MGHRRLGQIKLVSKGGSTEGEDDRLRVDRPWSDARRRSGALAHPRRDPVDWPALVLVPQLAGVVPSNLGGDADHAAMCVHVQAEHSLHAAHVCNQLIPLAVVLVPAVHLALLAGQTTLHEAIRPRVVEAGAAFRGLNPANAQSVPGRMSDGSDIPLVGDGVADVALVKGYDARVDRAVLQAREQAKGIGPAPDDRDVVKSLRI